MFAVTSIYAALLALLYVVLSVRVIQYRNANSISLGHADDPEMLRRVRVHANCAEYAPIGIILLALFEAQGAPLSALHVLGGMLLIGRAAHAWAVSAAKPVMLGRVLGMALTFGMLVLCALGLLLHTVV